MHVVEDRGQNRKNAHFLGEVLYAEKALQLLKRDDHRSATHESNQRCFRQKINYESEPGQIKVHTWYVIN